MKRAKLKQLEKVMDGVADSTLFQLKAATITCQALEREISELDAERARIMKRSTEDPSLLCFGFASWLRWAETRKATLNMSLSRARATREAARRKAMKAFGRSQALHLLLEKERQSGG